MVKWLLVFIVVAATGCAAHTAGNPRAAQYAREVSALFPAEEERIASLLAGFTINRDDVERIYFIRPKQGSSGIGNEARLYIGVTSDRQWLRMRLRYYGDSWLFVNRYTIAADEYRWESPTLIFQRDHSGGMVWEWVDKAPDIQDIENMRILASARSPLIRFYGRQYYKDFALTRDQQAGIRDALGLYNILEQARQ